MDAHAIEDLGGILQIIGTGIVVVDLLAIHGYLGDPKRLKKRARIWRVRVEAWLRRLLRLPGKDIVVQLGTASGDFGFAGSATVRAMPGPFVLQPDLSPSEQLAAQAEYLNRLRDWMVREVEQRDQAARAEREQARAKLQAERERVDRLLGDARERFNRLRKLTTRGTGLRWLAVLVLLAGTAFSTWPDGWAEVWPAWLSTTMLGFLVACSIAVGLCWAIATRLRADSTAS